MKRSAEMARLKHKYRRLILTGKLRLPRKPATRLVGPDCAFHLYRSLPDDFAEPRADTDKRR